MVSNLGRVKSLPRNGTIKKERILKPSSYTGYALVTMRKNGKAHYEKVHRIVAKVFIPNPENKREVNHIDGDKLNNLVENLEWVTSSENQLHSFYTLGQQIVAIEQRTLDGRLIRTWRSIKEAALSLGLDAGTITNCCRGKFGHKSHGGFKFNYVKGDN